MKATKFLAAAAIIAAFSLTSCKPKDADIAKAISEKITSMPDLAGMTVDVKDGVATISGECKDEACKETCKKAVEGLAVKGVKSVVSNCTIKPAEVIPSPASTNVAANVLDPKLQDAVKAIIKDVQGLSIKGFTAKGVILEGAISAAQNTKVKQALMAAKILVDASSKVTIK